MPFSHWQETITPFQVKLIQRAFCLRDGFSFVLYCSAVFWSHTAGWSACMGTCHPAEVCIPFVCIPLAKGIRIWWDWLSWAALFWGCSDLPGSAGAHAPFWLPATDTQKVDHQKSFDKSFHFCRPWMSLSLLQDLGKCRQGQRWLLCCLPVIHTQGSSSKSKAGPKTGFPEIPYLTLLSKSLTVVAFNFSHNVLRLWYLNSFSFQLILAFQ